MAKKIFWGVIFIFISIITMMGASAADCGSIPTDDCYINNNTVFTTATYNVSRMTINASNIVVDCNDSTFENKSDYYFDALNNQENVTLKNCNWYPEGSGQGIRSQNDNLRNWTLDNLYINNKSITTGNYWHNLTYTRTEIYAPTVPDAPSNIQEIIRFNGTLTLKFNNWEIDEIRVQPISDVFGDHSMVLVDLNNFSHLNGSNNNAFEFLNINGAKFYNNTLQEMQLRDSAIGPQAGREIANIDIRDNTISDFATGIDFGFNGNNGTNINIIGNTISGTTTRDMDIVDKTNVTIKNHNTISSEGLMFIRGSNTQPQDYTITDNTFTMAGTTGISITCMSNMTFINNTIYGNGGGASAGDNRLLRLYGDCSLGTQGQVLMTENSFLNGTDISSLMLGNLGLSNSLEYISVYDNVFSGGIRLSGIWTDNVVVYNNSLTSFEILDGNSWDICNAGVGNTISDNIVVASFGLTATSHQFENACSPYTIPNGVQLTTSANLTTDTGMVTITGTGTTGINYTGTISDFQVSHIDIQGYGKSIVLESSVTSGTINNITVDGETIIEDANNELYNNSFQELTMKAATDLCNSGEGNTYNGSVELAAESDFTFTFENACSYSFPVGVLVKPYSASRTVNIVGNDAVFTGTGTGFNVTTNGAFAIQDSNIQDLDIRGYDKSFVFESGTLRNTYEDSASRSLTIDEGTNNSIHNNVLQKVFLTTSTDICNAGTSNTFNDSIEFTVSSDGQFNFESACTTETVPNGVIVNNTDTGNDYVFNISGAGVDISGTSNIGLLIFGTDSSTKIINSYIQNIEFSGFSNSTVLGTNTENITVQDSDFDAQYFDQGTTNTFENLTLPSPNVTLVSGVPGGSIQGQSAEFNYTPDQIASASFRSCQLYINSVLFSNDTSITEGVINSFSISGIPEGNNNWYITCLDEFGNSGSSSTQSLTVDIPGGAIGGGGGPTEVVTEKEEVLVPFFTRETALETTCGFDGDQDGLLCDPNEDWVACPEDCEFPSLDQVLCLSDRCVWREAWFVRMAFIFLLISTIYILYLDLTSSGRKRVIFK